MNRIVAVAALVVAGCATTGSPIYREQYAQAQIGKSTIADVRKFFGHPTDTLFSSSGTTELTWQWSYTETKATSFIPFAAYAGGAGVTGTSTKVVARFDRHGVLAELLRGGATLDVTSGTVFQGYESVGDQKATAGELEAMPTAIGGVGAKCRIGTPCPSLLNCAMVEGKDYGYCVGASPAQ
jgi:hypothetical protein